VSVNVGGTQNVLDACRETGARVVVTSTSEVYGTAADALITEEHRLHAQSPYAASKTAGDQLALSYRHSYGMPVAICRPFNTYGPGQSRRAVIPTIITQALWEDRIELGSTEPTRDFLYVSDTARGFAGMGENPDVLGRAVQLGTGREISVGDLAGLILDILGMRGKEIVCGPTPPNVSSRWMVWYRRPITSKRQSYSPNKTPMPLSSTPACWALSMQ
jgi:dTDP-glucose 4,6-dehydratase